MSHQRILLRRNTATTKILRQTKPVLLAKSGARGPRGDMFEKTISIGFIVPADHVKIMHDNTTLLGVDISIELTGDILTI
jgi:hypothetical protein